MYKEVFPGRLKKARIDAGYTQPQVSEELGISKGALSKYETGKVEPNIELLGKLADFYAVSTDWLIGLGQREPTPLSEELRDRRKRALASELAKGEAFPINVLFDIQDQLISKGIIKDTRSEQTIDKYIETKRNQR